MDKQLCPVQPKYSTICSRCSDKLIPKYLPDETRSLINAFLAQKSWQKHNSALNSFNLYEKSKGRVSSWPLSKEALRDFVTWAVSEKNLKPSTIQAYLSSLMMVHKLKSLDCQNFSDHLLTSMLKGAENLSFYKQMSKGARKAMTLPLLKILSHQLAQSDKSVFDKQVLWTAMLVAFFGSFRFGEILSPGRSSFNKIETLLWEDVEVKRESVIIHLKVTKSKTRGGEFVDLFELPNSLYCPVSAIKKLKKMKTGEGCSPVFRLKMGFC